MSAAQTSAAAPLFQEGSEFWQELLEECRKKVEAMNACAVHHGADTDDLLEWRRGGDLHIVKAGCPSTTVKAIIQFHAWGPVISVTVDGSEYEDTRFPREEFELPIAKDLDGEVVAIYDEGRSFSPRDLACYLAQSFHRCFPGVALPC